LTYTTLFFDLDETLYPKGCGVWEVIRDRIDLYMLERVATPAGEIERLRSRLFQQYGTTLRGLIEEYQINADDYLAFVHDVKLSEYIQPDLELAAILRSYPERKVILTNADKAHANRVLKTLGLEGIFEQIVDINTISPYCKPMREAFELALRAVGEVDAGKCVLVDDILANLGVARQMGFYTIWAGGDRLVDEAHASVKTLTELPWGCITSGNGWKV
jgi:putative hydrolase of the HAD superfamily